MYFCSESCEQKYREETKELKVSYLDGSYDWFCPIIEFEETYDELIFSNGNDYKLNKEIIEKWEIDRCTCLQEFMELNHFIL